MAPLSSGAKNGILLAVLGISTCILAGVIPYMLARYRDSVIVKDPAPRTQYITQDVEDSLKPGTLEKLVASHSYGIQEIASRIISDRALHDSATLDALLWELTRPDYDRRLRAMRAMLLLTEQASSSKLDTPKVWSALVRSLEYCLTDYVHEDYDPEFDNFPFRDVAERIGLTVIYRLMREVGPEGAVKAGFIPKWLAKEPWGNTVEERQYNFANIYRKGSTLSEIVLMFVHNPAGSKQLLKSNLVSKSVVELFDETLDTIMINGETTSGESGDLLRLGLTEGGPRIREQSVEERRLRRRHREAMVLNDGIQPVAVSDIIEREYRSPIEERETFTLLQ